MKLLLIFTILALGIYSGYEFFYVKPSINLLAASIISFGSLIIVLQNIKIIIR